MPIAAPPESEKNGHHDDLNQPDLYQLSREEIQRFAFTGTGSDDDSVLVEKNLPPRPLESKEADIAALVGSGDLDKGTVIKSARNKFLLVSSIAGVLSLILWGIASNLQAGLKTANTPKPNPTTANVRGDREPFDPNVADSAFARAALADQNLNNEPPPEARVAPTPTPTTPAATEPNNQPSSYNPPPPAPAPMPPVGNYNSRPPAVTAPASRVRTSPLPNPEDLWNQAANAGTWSATAPKLPGAPDYSVQPPPPPLNRTVTIGTTLEGTLISPVAWSDNVIPKGRYLISVTSDDPVIPAGSIIVAEIGETDNRGLINFIAKSIVINHLEYPISEGSIRIGGAENRMLKAQVKGQGFGFLRTLGLPFLQGLNTATSLVNRPQATNSIVSNNGFGSTTSNSVTNPTANVGAAALQGFTQSLVDQGNRRVEDVSNQKFYVIRDATPVRVQVTRTVNL
jgi:hypothetical protein